MKKIFSILLVALFALGMVSCSNSPKGVVKNFEKAIIKGDYDKAMSYTTLSEDMQKTFSGIMAEAAKKNADSQLKDFKILEVKEDGDKAVVKVEVTNKKGEKDTQEHNVVKKDGKWKIEVSK